MPLKMYDDKSSTPPKKKVKIIGIAAGKGGVGKSSVTANLALALKEQGYLVGILDADIYGPSIRKMVPEDTLPKQLGEKIIPAKSDGIETISMAYFRRENEAAVVRAPIANSVISQFLKQVEWSDLDYLLIDFPPGTGDIQLTLCQQANLAGAIMVTTPQEVALQDVRKAIHLFEQVNVPILGIVENMSYYYHQKSDEKIYIFGQGGGERLANEFGVPFLGCIPIDPEICQCGDVGSSLFKKDLQNLSLSVKAFHALAKQLILQTSADRPEMIFIKEVQQKDNHSFRIQWSDNKTTDFNFNELQAECPCAKCVDEVTGKRMVDLKSIDPKVYAKNISQVGRYALKIEFSSGCSTGIYSFEMLRTLAGV